MKRSVILLSLLSAMCASGYSNTITPLRLGENYAIRNDDRRQMDNQLE